MIPSSRPRKRNDSRTIRYLRIDDKKRDLSGELESVLCQYKTDLPSRDEILSIRIQHRPVTLMAR